MYKIKIDTETASYAWQFCTCIWNHFLQFCMYIDKERLTGLILPLVRTISRIEIVIIEILIYIYFFYLGLVVLWYLLSLWTLRAAHSHPWRYPLLDWHFVWHFYYVRHRRLIKTRYFKMSLGTGHSLPEVMSFWPLFVKNRCLWNTNAP